MSTTYRGVTVTVDGIEGRFHTEFGKSYAVGDLRMPYEVHDVTLPGGSWWCSVVVYRRDGASVSVNLNTTKSLA